MMIDDVYLSVYHANYHGYIGDVKIETKFDSVQTRSLCVSFFEESVENVSLTDYLLSEFDRLS